MSLQDLNISKTVYKPTNAKALFFLIIPLLILSAGVYLSLFPLWSITYFGGQLLLGLFFFQCFILIHEAGHFSFFKSKLINIFLGNIVGFISFIPFKSWIQIHNLHHKWTGFRDKDPTTEGTISPSFHPAIKLLINVSWLLWFPLFTIGYRLGNYWNIKKIKKHVPSVHWTSIYINVFIQVLAYIIIFYFFGLWIIQHLLIGYFISLIISDLFILSQHSHIEIPIADSEDVRPIRYAEQIQYTRSVDISSFIAKYIYLNFNLHESHHFQPGIPAYYLDKLAIETPNKVLFFDYLKDAKKMSGFQFIFSSSSKKVGERRSKI